MSYEDRQLSAKFKGVSFFVRNESLNNVGQTRVKHTYPKTSVQYLESMGQEPFSETIDLFFHGPNFRENFQKFKKAIQDPAPGRLFSPTYGVFNSIVANPSTFTSSQTSLGVISASVLFEETIDRPSPTEADTSERDVSERSQEAREELQAEFADEYPEPDTLNNILTSEDDAVSLSDQLKKITGDIRGAKAFVEKINRVVRNSEGYASLLLNPGQPQGYLQSVALSTLNFSVFRRMASMGSNLTNSMNDIFTGIVPVESSVTPQTPESRELDLEIPLWNTDTVERKQRNLGRVSLINTFRITGLIGMYESAAAQEYTTTDEIDEITNTIEEYYIELVENDTTEIIIPKLKPSLDEIRSLTDRVLSAKRQQAYSITEIEVIKPISSFLLSYELYGEYLQTETQHGFFSDLIAGLNRSMPRNRLEGTVRVVEIGNRG